MNKIKRKKPSALQTIEDLEAVILMTEGEETTSDLDYDVRWDTGDILNDSDDIALMKKLLVSDEQVSLSTNVNIHGRNNYKSMSAALSIMHSHLKRYRDTHFSEVSIDTGANTIYVMCLEHHRAYKKELGRNLPIRPPVKMGVKGIGAYGTIIGGT